MNPDLDGLKGQIERASSETEARDAIERHETHTGLTSQERSEAEGYFQMIWRPEGHDGY